MKIFVCEIKQESNSFNPLQTGLSSFARAGILRGEEILKRAPGMDWEISGMLQAIEEFGGQPVPGVMMRSGSGGPVEQSVVDDFLAEITPMIEAAKPLDGVFIVLHGAMLTESSEDSCGDVLEHIRQLVGETVVIAASCDLHANVTPRMLKNADYISGFQTYPHLDTKNTGYRAAKLGMLRLTGEKAKLAAVRIPMMASASDYSTGEGALFELMKKAHGLVSSGELLDFTVFQVQPWLNISEIGSTVVTVARDAETAVKWAETLAAEEFSLRNTLLRDHLSIDEVIELAKQHGNEKPVVLVDSADSPNAGAPCDSAEVLRHLLPHANQLRAAFPISDAPTVEKAFKVGVGAEESFTMGGTLAPGLTQPLTLTAKVKSLHEGIFTLEGPAWRGNRIDIGRSAVLSVGGIEILVATHASRCGDPQLFRGFGIEPTLCQLVVIKACTSFRAAYEPIASLICPAATPGAASADLKSLPFTRLPKPFYPFQEISEQEVGKPVVFR